MSVYPHRGPLKLLATVVELRVSSLSPVLFAALDSSVACRGDSLDSPRLSHLRCRPHACTCLDPPIKAKISEHSAVLNMFWRIGRPVCEWPWYCYCEKAGVAPSAIHRYMATQQVHTRPRSS